MNSASATKTKVAFFARQPVIDADDLSAIGKAGDGTVNVDQGSERQPVFFMLAAGNYRRSMETRPTEQTRG